MVGLPDLLLRLAQPFVLLSLSLLYDDPPSPLCDPGSSPGNHHTRVHHLIEGILRHRESSTCTSPLRELTLPMKTLLLHSRSISSGSLLCRAFSDGFCSPLTCPSVHPSIMLPKTFISAQSPPFLIALSLSRIWRPRKMSSCRAVYQNMCSIILLKDKGQLVLILKRISSTLEGKE